MTDTGQVPGEGLPENAGTAEQPGVPAHAAYAYLSETTAQDEDQLLLPGAQSPWGNEVAPPAPEPVVEALHQPGPHETGGRDSGSVDLGGVRLPEPPPASPTLAAAPTRRPLHLGPVIPDASASPVRSLADRGPAGAPVRQPLTPPPAGPEYLDAPAAPRDTPPQGGAPWGAPTPAPATVHTQVAMETWPAQEVGQAVAEPITEPAPEPVAEPVPEAVVEPVAEAAPEVAPEPVAEPEPVAVAVAVPEAVVEPVAEVAPEPVAAPVAEPVEPVAEAFVEPTVAAVPAPVAEPVVEPVAQPVPELVSVAQSVGVPQTVAVAREPREHVVQAAVRQPDPAESPAVVPPQVPAQVQVPAPMAEHGYVSDPAAHAVPQETPVAPLVEEAAGPVSDGTGEAVVESDPAEAAPVAPDTGEAVTRPEPAPEPVPVIVPEVEPVAEPVAPEAVAPEEPAPGTPVQEPAAPAEPIAPEDLQAAQVPQAPEAPEALQAPEIPEFQVAEFQVADAQVVEVPVAVPSEPPAEAAVEPVEDPALQTLEQPAPEPVFAPEPAVQPVAADGTEPTVSGPEAAHLQHPEEAMAPEAEAGAQQEQSAVDQPQDTLQPQEPVAEPGAPRPTGPAAPGYDEAERAAVLKVMRERRDIRNGFRDDPIPHDVLLRVLEAAHTAPSVGHSQPWDFVVIRSADTRRGMHELAMRQRDAYAKSLPKGRAKQFKELKIEAILDTPVNIVVTADPTRGGRHTLGRHTQPQMAPYSAALAVENLWLAARAEGLGVGWVSFFDEREMVRALGLPEHLEVIAYLCVGYVEEFPDEPELLQAGWSKRRPLSWVVHEETYGRRALPGEDPHDLLGETVSQIRPLDAKALGEAWERQKRMTKPAGALGMLEIISAQLSGLSRQCPPPIPEPAAVAIFAGDHGVHAQGVTPWPQEVTAQMVANFLGGGAVCNAFAAQVGAEVCVVDVGVATDLPATPGLLPRKVRAGTSDMTTGPAMTREEAKKAIEVGIETARDLVAAGNKALLTGEMGIANTTASAALISVFTGADPAEVTGRGTGINDETLARKTDVVRRALDFHQPDPADPIGVLAAVGGFEHAAIVGLLLGGASLRTPVILDGVSAGAAALVARAIAPEVLAACIAGHRSAEPGHVAALNKLGLRPLVDLDLRLGEGTGALLALPMVQSTARAMHEVATFDSAGVTEK